MKKRSSFLLLIFCITTSGVFAQRGLKIAYIDMDYILKNVSSYQQARQQLDQKAQKWKSEIELKMKSVEDMKQNLENERVLLTKELIEERQEDIAFEEKKVLDYQQARFGPQGDLMIQKRQLIQPVQDQVFNAIQEIGKKREYDFIFENSTDALMLYSAKRHDISDQVLSYINRSEQKLKVEERKNKRKESFETDEKPYKSVEKASSDEQEKAKRQAELQRQKTQRQNVIDERRQKKDSVRAARQKAYEARRKKILEERQHRRDSLKEARSK